MTTEHTKTAEGWGIDTSTGTPILVYKNCSVIESEQASYVLSLIAADRAAPKAPSADPDMRAICEALGFDPTNHHNALKCPYCRPADPAQQATKGECILCHGTGKHYQAMAILPGQPECAARLVDCKQCAAPLAAQKAPAERYCNKCGYFGPDELHQRPNGTGECGYLSTPRTPQPAAPVQPSTKVGREGLTDDEAGDLLRTLVTAGRNRMPLGKAATDFFRSRPGIPAPTVGDKGEGK